MSEFDDFSAGNTVFGLKALEIHETRCLDNIAKILKKFTGYANNNLTSLKISYYPPAIKSSLSVKNSKSSYFDFCRELKNLIHLCANSLQVLILDVQHEPTLDFLGYHVGKELAALGCTMDLKEFVLSPAIGVWLHKPEESPRVNVAMAMKSASLDAENALKSAAASLARFLESQKNLKKLGLPCIEYPEAFSSCFKSLLQRIPSAATLEYLAVPCAGFLPEDFLHQFPKLKRLKIGGSCCEDASSPWDAFRHYYGGQAISPIESEGILPSILSDFKIKKRQTSKSLSRVTDETSSELLDMTKSIEELSISTKLSPPKFNILAKSLCNLTSLEVNSLLNNPVFSDADLQACVKYLKKLTSLVIGCCDELTDFGVTGIPNKYCMLMFRHQTYHSTGANPNIWTSDKVHGRPLSDLKGLKKLVLSGNSHLTDIGIVYGLNFNELTYCHLPYSDNITDWGIERFGKMNPSMQTFVISGVNQLMKEAFLNLRKSHDRIKKGDSSRLAYYSERKSPLEDNISLILPTPLEVLNALYTFFSKKFSTIYTAMRGQQRQSGGLEIEMRN